MARSRRLGIALDVLDHLGVVVGGERCLVFAAGGHGQVADEVGQPCVRRRLQLRVLVQEVVDLPAFVGDPDVEPLLADEVVEDHEVRAEDLVHPSQGLECVQVVVARLAVDVRNLARERRACRMDRLAALPQHGCHRLLREPVDLEAGHLSAQLVGDRDVAPRMPQTDRR